MVICLIGQPRQTRFFFNMIGPIHVTCSVFLRYIYYECSYKNNAVKSVWCLLTKQYIDIHTVEPLGNLSNSNTTYLDHKKHE